MFIQLVELYPLTDARKSLLKDYEFSETEPGSILYDFEMLLGYIANEKVELTNSLLHFPRNLLELLNQKLNNPIEIDLKRPSMKSYPHIMGLYMLVQCSGLVKIESDGKTSYFTIRPALVEKWNELNPTEKHIYLLESWFLRGDEGLLDPKYLGPYPDVSNLMRSSNFLSRFQDGKLLLDKKQIYNSLNYWPRWQNLGLLDLFGIIDIERKPSVSGKGWQIKSANITTFGEAMLAVLGEIYVKAHEEDYARLNLEPNQSGGLYQELLKDYFTNLKNTLSVSQISYVDPTYIFKVYLTIDIWRRIAINSSMSLDMLAETILKAFNFDNDHLYDFKYRNIYGLITVIGHPYLGDYPFTDEVLVGDISLDINEIMTFTFDFGDNWQFAVQLEETTSKDKVKTSKIIEIHGDAPEQYGFYDDEDDDLDSFDESYEFRGL